MTSSFTSSKSNLRLSANRKFPKLYLHWGNYQKIPYHRVFEKSFSQLLDLEPPLQTVCF